MPYIKPERRAALDTIIDGLINRLTEIKATKGDVNYTITRLVLGSMPRPAEGWNYASLSDAISVMRDAATEIERRTMARYEDCSKLRNGDLSEFVVEDTKSTKRLADVICPPIAEAAAAAYVDMKDEIDGRR